MMKKKITAAIVTIAVIMTATAAFAHGDMGRPRGPRGPHCGEEMRCPKMTEEQRAQFEEMRELEHALDAELRKDTVDKEKAMSLKKQIVDIRAKESAKRFEQMLNNPKPKDRPEMSEEQKARMKKMRKLEEAIRTELEKETPNKTRATALHNEILQLRKECELEGFEHMLNNPKKFDKGHCPGHRGGRGPKPNPDWEF